MKCNIMQARPFMRTAGAASPHRPPPSQRDRFSGRSNAVCGGASSAPSVEAGTGAGAFEGVFGAGAFVEPCGRTGALVEHCTGTGGLVKPFPCAGLFGRGFDGKGGRDGTGIAGRADCGKAAADAASGAAAIGGSSGKAIFAPATGGGRSGSASGAAGNSDDDAAGCSAFGDAVDAAAAFGPGVLTIVKERNVIMSTCENTNGRTSQTPNTQYDTANGPASK